MNCSKCRFENPAGVKFCGRCGAKLELVCPNCRVSNPMQFKFCGECGQQLTEDATSRLIPQPERKYVTALFSDLTGYTSMTEKLDPEQVKEITSQIFTGVKQIVAKYEGFIERVMGDGCLAFFGIPRSHEDDQVRAIHCASEIHRFVKGLSPQYESRIGAPLTMHSGINTGLVVTADVDLEKGTHGVAGDAVNVASRLSSMAGPDEILIGAETVRRTKGRFTFEDLGHKQAKGKAEPIAVFKVVSAKSPTKGIGVDRQVSSEMVGRDKELDKLEFQIMKAINGEGSVVNVIGEAGIGKSRLIAELKKSQIMKRVTLLEGRAISIGKNLSFHPITDLFKQWAMIGEGDSETAAFDKLERAIRQVHPEETNEMLPFLATLMGMKLVGKHADRVKGIEGEALEKLIFKNVRELVIKGAELRPTVVVMEDLHWADTSSLEMLEALYRLAEKHRIAFINVFRPGYFDGEDGKITKTGQLLPVPFVEIEIQPLDNDDAESLIDNMLAIRGLPYPVKRQIVERAGGNPFFIEEVVRSLIDEGAVVRRDGGFEVTDKIGKVVIPPTINDVLMARIDRLEEKTRELVKVASVIGRNFFDRVIKDVADSIEDADYRLTYLKHVQLIRDRMRMQELEYLFKHALAQEAAYESTLLQQRKALHLKVAQSIEKIFYGRLHEFYGMLAFHYSKGENAEKAEEYMMRAGEEALRSSASSEALNYFRDALKLYLDRYGEKADPQKINAFKKNLALANWSRGQFAEALPYFDDVLSSRNYTFPESKFAQRTRTVGHLLAIAVSLYSPVHFKTRFPSTEETQDLELLVKRGQCAYGVDLWSWLVEYLRLIRLLGRYNLGELDQGPQWLSLGSALFAAIGMYGMAERLLKRSASLIPDENQGPAAFAMVGTVLPLFGGAWHAADDLRSSIVDSGLSAGHLFDTTLYLVSQGFLRLEQGVFDKSDFCAGTVLSIADRYAYEYARVQYHRLRSTTLIRIGSLNEAMAEAEAGITVAHQCGLKAFIINLLGNKAIAEALLKLSEEAQLSVVEGALMLETGIMVSPMYLTTFLVGRALMHLGLLKKKLESEFGSDFLQLRTAAYRSTKEAVRVSKRYAPFRTWILRLMGDYYWLTGTQHRAMKWYDKSMREGERLGARPDLSRTYFEVGKRLLESQSKYKQLNAIDAKGYLEKAEKLFREMRLENDLDELERVMSDLA